MAGRKRRLTTEEQLNKTINDIAETEIILQELKELKIQLEEELNHKRLEELDELIKNSGKSFDEIKLLLNV